jgi:aldose 1-epimerase
MSKNYFRVLPVAALLLFAIGCNRKSTETQAMTDSVNVQSKAKISVASFGLMPDGTPISQYTLMNSQGMTMKVINYGGIITNLTAPDKNGTYEDVVLGFDSLSSYLKANPYFGAVIGRYGNRIAKGKFTLDGKAYSLAQNNGPNNLHGGPNGFDKRVWTIEEQAVDNGVALKLTYLSKDMEEGYPGNLNAEVIYQLTDSNELKINYRATADKKTIVNLTQHTYFNLSGNTKTDILGHELFIAADQFVPVDKTLIPTGKLQSVSETAFDFKTPVTIGSRIDKDEEQLKFGGGYDHCWVLRELGDSLKLAATLHDPSTGRVMSVHTTEPGIQFYSGNFLDGSLTGKYGVVYNKRYGLCLETEHFPDSPNQKSFPSVVLNPGEEYKTRTVYTFSVK